MIVGGFDLSLTDAGVTILDTDTRLYTARRHTSKPGARVPSPAHKGRKKDRGIFPVWERAERIDRVARNVLGLTGALDLAVIEAPSFASIGGHPHERSGLFWIIATTLARRGVQIVEVPPTSRALYATGNGAAGKASVVDAMVERYELSFRNDNIVDAVVLAAMGARYLGAPIEDTLPPANLAAMNGVLWPNTKGTK